MNTQANAKASFRKCHPDQQKTVDHDDGNDDFGPLGGWVYDDRGPAVTMPAPRGIDVFDHHHVWDERGGGHQHHQSSDGLLAVIGGSAMAAGDASAVTCFVENFAEDRGDYSTAMRKAIFEASAYECNSGGALAAAGTFLDVLGADFIFDHEIGQSQPGPYDAWARSELTYFSIDIHGWSPPHGTIVIDVHHPPRSADRAGPVLWQLRASARTGRGARRRHLVRHYQCTYHSKTTSRS